MIDKKITYNKIEDLLREVARIEFSMEYDVSSTVAASNARKSVENLLKIISDDDN